MPSCFFIGFLSQIRAIQLRLEAQRYLLRTDLKGVAHLAFKAVGLRPPPLAQLLEGAAETAV